MAQTDDEMRKTVRDQALAWFVRLHSGDATPADRDAHAAWMAAGVAHRDEYGRLGGIWTDLDRIPDPRARPVELAACRPRRSRRAFLAGGAAALAAGVAGIVVGPPDFLSSDHATGTGEQRTVKLTDGTAVTLDADSAIALDYTQTLRGVRLLRGRAFFDVAKDALRPFTVFAADGSATALGTRFVVHEWSGTVTVSVEESAVSVKGPDARDAVVKAGQSVTYDRRQLSAVAAADVESEGAWRRGKLIFEDRPLRQVLADVNRYRSGTIRVTDGRLLNMRVSGIFDVRDPDGVLEAIRTSLPVRTFALSPWLVILHPA